MTSLLLHVKMIGSKGKGVVIRSKLRGMGEEAGGRREIAMEIGGPRNREDPR
jgi:hypothetical protein